MTAPDRIWAWPWKDGSHGKEFYGDRLKGGWSASPVFGSYYYIKAYLYGRLEKENEELKQEISSIREKALREADMIARMKLNDLAMDDFTKLEVSNAILGQIADAALK